MKHVIFESFGPPSRVAKCVDAADPPPPGPWEVTVDITASPINPSDISVLRGHYGMLPARFPAQIGYDACGVVTAVGSDVTTHAIGDRVFVLANENWTQRRNLSQKLAIKVPDELDDLQVSMSKTNALCTYFLLKMAELEEGDYIVQLAPLSAVGRMNIGMAKALGYRTINIVRRQEAMGEVRDLGGDVVLMDGDDIGARVADAANGEPVPLGLDCVAGEATSRLADCLDTGAVLVNYGMLSGEPCVIRADQTIFKDIQLRGFWLSKVMNRGTHTDRVKAVEDCMDLMVKHNLRNQVGKTFSLSEVGEALDYAESPERNGKVILVPNGAVDTR